MTRLARLPVCAVWAALTICASASTLGGCAKVTTIESEYPIQISARPPAPPLPDLPSVARPPPPPRVTIEGELLSLDEALTFDDEGQLAVAQHDDILGEVATWLEKNADVTALSVEVHSVGEGSKRTHKKRSQALAAQIVDALVERGVDASRLVAASVGKSEEGTRDVVLRVSERAEAATEG